MLVHVQVGAGKAEQAAGSPPRPRVMDVEIQLPDELAGILGAEEVERAALFAAQCLLTECWKHRKAVRELYNGAITSRDDVTVVVVAEEGVG